MKLQKLTEKRWFWPLVCAVSVVFGWWYLSIVTCAPLGGDDELINLQNYYYITHTSFGQSVLDYIGDLVDPVQLAAGAVPALLLAAGARADELVFGRIRWAIGSTSWPATYADILLTGWLVGKASHNKKLGIACICLLPMMFSVWQDSTGNSLYSYGALVQSTPAARTRWQGWLCCVCRIPGTSGGPCWRGTARSSAVPRLKLVLPILCRFSAWPGSTPTRPATPCG